MFKPDGPQPAINAARMVLLVATCLIGSAAWAEGAWRPYYNDRFGVTADAPSDWKMGPAPENNDGRIFTSPNGSATITISGSFSTMPHDEEVAIRVEQKGAAITYKKITPRLVVVSGTKSDRIFYSKSILSCHGTIWNDLRVEYPVADKDKYDALVAHVSASLHPGPGYDFNGKCK